MEPDRRPRKDHDDLDDDDDDADDGDCIDDGQNGRPSSDDFTGIGAAFSTSSAAAFDRRGVVFHQ